MQFKWNPKSSGSRRSTFPSPLSPFSFLPHFSLIYNLYRPCHSVTLSSTPSHTFSPLFPRPPSPRKRLELAISPSSSIIPRPSFQAPSSSPRGPLPFLPLLPLFTTLTLLPKSLADRFLLSRTSTPSTSTFLRPRARLLSTTRRHSLEHASRPRPRRADIDTGRIPSTRRTSLARRQTTCFDARFSTTSLDDDDHDATVLRRSSSTLSC